MTFPITGANLVGSFCDAVFYGIYLVTCTTCFRILFMTGSGREERWRHPSEVRWMMAIGGLILFIVCTLDITLAFSSNYRAFVHSENAEKALIADWSNIAEVRTAFGAWVADFILIYRCWIVCGGHWPVIVPSVILYLTNLAISFRVYAMMAEAGGIPHGTVPENAGAFRSFLLAFFTTIATQNVLTTGILIWRIWLVERKQTKLNGDPPRYLRQIIRALAESGAAYTTFVLMTLIASAAHSNALYPISGMATGIAFNLILIRCSPERDRQFTTFHRELSTLRIAHKSTTLGSDLIVLDQQKTTREMKSIGACSEHYTNERSSHDNFESKDSDIGATKKVVEVEAHV
ncbi:hypothetical protein AN958_05143 [Leucoagaricus sp. SymC.cos]|nr:hypothetical protein AN958_05143 [Leucoagaricus sp. SymC.cos]